MNWKLYDLKRALQYSVLLWIIGFIWGMVVFIVPLLKNIQTVPFISKYPAISIPLLIVCTILVIFFTNKYLKGTKEKTTEAIKFGVTIFLTNFVLDFVTYYILFQSTDYFAYLSIWLSYGLMIVVPWLVRKRSS